MFQVSVGFLRGSHIWLPACPGWQLASLSRKPYFWKGAARDTGHGKGGKAPRARGNISRAGKPHRRPWSRCGEQVQAGRDCQLVVETLDPCLPTVRPRLWESEWQRGEGGIVPSSSTQCSGSTALCNLLSVVRFPWISLSWVHLSPNSKALWPGPPDGPGLSPAAAPREHSSQARSSVSRSPTFHTLVSDTLFPSSRGCHRRFTARCLGTLWFWDSFLHSSCSVLRVWIPLFGEFS